ncbi:MAG: pyridoxal-phosphate dependent enzyme [Pseudomonadota bacterium]
MPLHIETPLLQSRQLSQLSGRPVWLKMDALQAPGSFKIRGVGHACTQHVSRGARRLVSSSGGNAGLAVAYAGRTMDVPVTVVVPQTTSERAKELLKLEDAEVIVHGASWQEANELALSMVGPTDAFLHPFDDPLLWRGHATVIDEVARAGLKPDAVVLSVGGGGLLSGVAEGLHRNGWGNIPIIAVETEGAASFHAAAKAGHAVQLDQISSIATSLGAKRVCEQAVKWSKEHTIESVLVSDKSAVGACERFLADHRVLVEPACGASLALAYENSPALQRFDTVLVIVCGGATATVEQLQQWAKAL